MEETDKSQQQNTTKLNSNNNTNTHPSKTENQHNFFRHNTTLYNKHTNITPPKTIKAILNKNDINIINGSNLYSNTSLEKEK